MANTSIATSHGLTLEQWESKLYTSYQEQTFFGRFKGTDENSVIQVKRDLAKSKGDAITFGLAGTLVGAGVTGNTTLAYGATSNTGNEEAMSFDDQKVTIDQVRNGTRISGIMDEQRVAFSMRNQAKTQLTDWMARNEDAAIFTAINSCDIVTAATIGSPTALSPDVIVKMKKEAMFPTAANISAGNTTNKLRPIKTEGGEEVFVLGINPAEAAELRLNADFKQMNREADVRGKSNKLFSGAMGMISGVVVYEHSDFDAGKPVLLGAQAGFLAYANEVIYAEEEFDYGNQSGFMIGSVRGVSLAKFTTNGKSHGAIQFVI